MPDYLISTLCLFMYFYSNQFNMDGIQSYIVIWKSEKIISLQNSEVNICCTHSNFQSNLFCITQIFRYFKWNHWFFGIRHDTQHSTVAYFGRSVKLHKSFFCFFLSVNDSMFRILQSLYSSPLYYFNDITEILLKVVLNTITLSLYNFNVCCFNLSVISTIKFS